MCILHAKQKNWLGQAGCIPQFPPWAYASAIGVTY